MNGVVEALSKFGAARIGAMLAVALALVGFFGFVMMRATQPQMAVLYADVPFSEVAAITKELDARGVRYEMRQDGQTILAPKADIPRIRLDLASKGLPTGGTVGYEIFDKGDAFSSTSFVQNVNHLRALEGELARTIRGMGRVTAARVHLVLPERRVFERERQEPRASIALRVRGELEPAQVKAIRHLVASAVEGLKPERISIVDEAGRLLADGAAADAGAAGMADERQTGLERRLRGQIEDIVASIVGQGRARVQVTAELDLNRIQQTQEAFDPESRVLRSTQTRNEASQTSAGGDGQVSVGNELPGQQRANQQNAQRDGSTKNEEIANYDYTKTVRSETHESGRIKKISVAVLVDGVYARGANNEATYQPRPPEEMERIATLVRGAIGFDRGRGDSVEVVNLRFAEPPRAPDLGEPPGFIASLTPSREDIYRGVELLALAVLTIIVLFAVVRPLVGRIIGAESNGARKGANSGGGGDETPAVAGPGKPESAAAKLIEIAQVNGQVHAQSIERVGELVKSNPQEALAVLRSMISGKA